MPNRTDEIVRIEIPLPFRPRSVNAFLVPLDDGGSMLVDGGYDSESAWAALAAGVAAAGGWSSICLNVVTHMHLDHVGLAYRVKEATSIPMAMGEIDAIRSAHAAANPEEERDSRARLLRVNGAPEAEVAAVRDASLDPRAALRFVAADVLLPSFTAPVPGAPEWCSIWTPGHTAGHIALFRARDRAMIAGDAVIPRVSPTIGVNPHRADPVGDYLESLDHLSELEPEWIHGGHGEPLSGTGRIAELRAEVLAESDRVQALLRPDPSSAWEIAVRRYVGRDLPVHLRLLAFRETLAHLTRLASRGDAIRTEWNGVRRFAAA
jgi:glyoxylase-like metal-dependent hydrolase (beta-lactamase superfamily II)